MQIAGCGVLNFLQPVEPLTDDLLVLARLMCVTMAQKREQRECRGAGIGFHVRASGIGIALMEFPTSIAGLLSRQPGQACRDGSFGIGRASQFFQGGQTCPRIACGECLGHIDRRNPDRCGCRFFTRRIDRGWDEGAITVNRGHFDRNRDRPA